jgi:ribonuclease HII
VLEHERTAWRSGARRVCGIDEAGRGPLAGPVVAAAVWIDADFLNSTRARILRGLTDSKQLSPPLREHFFDVLHGLGAVSIGVGMAEVEEIDRLNILRATHSAMARAIDALPIQPDRALIDGLPVPGLAIPSTAIVKGDGQSRLIAAASVVAKVTRDRIMADLDARYPPYGFRRNKGYGTPGHRAALRTFGPTLCHRRTFQPVRQMEWTL